MDFDLKTPDACTRLDAFMTEHPRGRFGQVAYDLGGDFGVGPAELRRRFGFYIARLGCGSKRRTVSDPAPAAGPSSQPADVSDSARRTAYVDNLLDRGVFPVRWPGSR